MAEERHRPSTADQVASLRRASPKDAPTVASIHRRAAFLPPPLGAAEHLHFVRKGLMADYQVWLIEAHGEFVGYVAFDDDVLSHLMVLPEHQGRGYGATLLAHAMADGRERYLWTYQRNTRARSFYEAHGWEVVELTDGGGNEHGEPEVRYVSRP